MGDPSALNYADLGWDFIDGHRCLKVRLDAGPGPPNKEKPHYLFWIDMERGCHPLRVEFYLQPPDLESRVHEIRLTGQHVPGGKTLCVPAVGTKETFSLVPGKYEKEPAFREKCSLVEGTLRVNSGFPDSIFSLRRKDEHKQSNLLLVKQFEHLYENSPPPERSDPESVEKRLKEQLIQADQDAKMVEATSPARETWNSTLIFQVLLFSVGVILITWTLVLLRRR